MRDGLQLLSQCRVQRRWLVPDAREVRREDHKRPTVGVFDANAPCDRPGSSVWCPRNRAIERARGCRSAPLAALVPGQGGGSKRLCVDHRNDAQPKTHISITLSLGESDRLMRGNRCAAPSRQDEPFNLRTRTDHAHTSAVPTGCVSEHLSGPRVDALANCLSTSLWVSEFPQYRCLFLCRSFSIQDGQSGVLLFGIGSRPHEIEATPGRDDDAGPYGSPTPGILAKSFTQEWIHPHVGAGAKGKT
jgi:hypothetical protein